MKNTIPHKLLNINSSHLNFETISIAINISKKEIINISAIYATPGTIIDYNQWQLYINQLPGENIIGGDFNAHSPSWGCAFEDRAGRAMLDNCDSQSLIILNDGSNTMVPRLNRNTWPIDLTISSPAIANKLSWTVLDDELGSDHFPIEISLKHTSYFQYMVPTSRINYRNINYDKFRKILTENVPPDSSNLNVNSYNNLISKIQEAAALSSIKNMNVAKKQSRSSPPWWDSDCSDAIIFRKSKFSIYKNHMNYSNFLEFKKSDAMVKRLLKVKKRTKWKLFCSEINKNTPNNIIWKKINLFKNLNSSQSINHSHLLEEFCDMITPPNVENCMKDFSSNVHHHFLTQEFSIREFEIALHNKRNSSPGSDDISYQMIRELPSTIKMFLINLMNWFWENCIFPPSWSTFNVVMVPKANKDPMLASSYRPITLASCIVKTFETMVKSRLEWWLESNELMPSTQHGFRKGKSTLDNLSILYNEIHTTFINRGFTTAISLDIKGAFDNVNIDLLAEDLSSLNLPNKLINSIYKIYHSRDLYFKNKFTYIGPRKATLGLPQGLILSPLLFTLYIKNIENLIPTEVKLVSFADDILIYTSSHSIDINNSRLSLAMESIHNFLSNKGLEIAFDKTFAIIFTRKYKIAIPSYIRIYNFNITVKLSLKFLGIYLDSKLNWKSHINYIASKCEKKINILKSISTTKWGSDPSTCLLLYRSIIRPIFDYGCPLFHNAPTSTTIKLDRIQFRCIRQSLGALKSSPTNSLLVEAKEMPLAIRRQLLSDNYILRKLTMSDDVISSIHSAKIIINSKCPNKPLSSYIKSLDYLNDHNIKIFDKFHIYTYDYYIQIFIPTINYFPHKKNTPFLNILFINYMKTHFSSEIQIFTDGSKKSSGTGCAFTCPSFNQSRTFKLPDSTSIFNAEAYAILSSLQYVQSINTHSKFVICTDSLSSLQALQGYATKNNKSYLIAEIIKELITTTNSGKSVQFLWIPGHSGISGNIEADLLAQLAIIHGEVISMHASSDEIRCLIKRKAFKDWQNLWTLSSQHKGKHLFSIMPTIPERPWFDVFPLFRRLTIQIIRLRLGHSLTPEYLHRIGVRETPFCSCGDLGDLNHCYLGCSLLREKLNRLLLSVDRSLELPTDIRCLLLFMFDNTDAFRFVIRYIISVGDVSG